MTRKKKRRSSNKISNLTNTILSILKKERNKTFNYKQIASILGLNDASSRNQIIKKLQQLKTNNDIEEVDRGKFKAIVNTEYHTGILDITSKGSGYVNAAISSEYVAYNSSGHPGYISSDKRFDFIGTYIGVAWPKARKGFVHVEGYRNTKLVYNDTLKLSNRIPVYFYANYSDITSLKIYSDIYWQVILENSQFYLSQ